MRKAAFTLMEMVIAITVFTTFIGLVVGVYLSFHNTQREVAVERQLALELQHTLSVVSEEIKTRPLDYSAGPFGAQLNLEGWSVRWDRAQEELWVKRDGEEHLMHSPKTRVSFANFRVFPDSEDEKGYQPHVKIHLEFERDGERQDRVSMDLESTVTTRQ